MKSNRLRNKSEVLPTEVALPMARRIERWPIDRLIPYTRNPRTHSEVQVAQIVASIVEFGFLNPILVDTRAGIIAGHGRLRAAQKLQLSKIPVIVLDHLTESQKRAYVIADNRLAENAGWDEELFRLELAALGEENFNVSVTGFEDEDLARLLAQQEAIPGLTDEDAVPEPDERPITVPGDVPDITSDCEVILPLFCVAVQPYWMFRADPTVSWRPLQMPECSATAGNWRPHEPLPPYIVCFLRNARKRGLAGLTVSYSWFFRNLCVFFRWDRTCECS